MLRKKSLTNASKGFGTYRLAPNDNSNAGSGDDDVSCILSPTPCSRDTVTRPLSFRPRVVPLALKHIHLRVAISEDAQVMKTVAGYLVHRTSVKVYAAVIQ